MAHYQRKGALGRIAQPALADTQDKSKGNVRGQAVFRQIEKSMQSHSPQTRHGVPLGFGVLQYRGERAVFAHRMVQAPLNTLTAIRQIGKICGLHPAEKRENGGFHGREAAQRTALLFPGKNGGDGFRQEGGDGLPLLFHLP